MLFDPAFEFIISIYFESLKLLHLNFYIFINLDYLNNCRREKISVVQLMIFIQLTFLNFTL